MTDFKTLRALDPKSFMDAAQHMNAASDKQNTARGDYATQVAVPVEGGDIWSDDAQPDAVTVLNIMDLAFDTSSTLMASAAVTTTTLAIELHAAKGALDKVVSDAVDKGLEVHDDGKVVEGPKFTVPQSHGYNPYSGSIAGAVDLGAPLVEEYQGLVDLAVQRATDADDACSKLLQQIAYTDVPMATTAEPGLLATAQWVNDQAYQTYGQASQLLLQLQNQANTNLQKYKNAHENPVLGILKGLWEGLTGIWNAAMTIASLPVMGVEALCGSDSAKQWFSQLGDGLSKMNLGDLIDLDDLKNGRYGEFIGQNLWWLLPVGKLGDLGKAADAGAKGLADLGRGARQTLADVRATLHAGVGGRAPIPGKPWTGTGKTSQQLVDAGTAQGKGGVPRSVQEMDKHATGQRGSGDKFPPLKGGPAQKLETAQQQLGQIMTNPRTREVPIVGGKFKGGYYYIAPDGRGVAYDAAGNLQYFGEFTYPG
ncbi:MAG TPA: hypothetical protein VF053_21800 [Streptosporangiales bacterium]